MNTTIAVQGSYALRMLTAIRGRLETGLLSFRTWRENQSAIAHLRSMSDAELKDIGIERETIVLSVTRGHRDGMWQRLDVI